jgi:hypothetical protein
MVKAERVYRIVDAWMRLAAFELAKEAAALPDGQQKKDLIERAWKSWNYAHGRSQ